MLRPAAAAIWAGCLLACFSLGMRPSQASEAKEILISTQGPYPQRVLLMLPRGFNPKVRYPLIVAFHGHGGDIKGFSIAFSGFRDLPVLIAIPEGEYLMGGGGHSWYVQTKDRNLWEEADGKSVARALEAISEITSSYPVDKVYTFGFSQGASMAYMVGLGHPALVTGVAAVSGYLPEVDQSGSLLHEATIAKAKNVRIFIARGADDALVGREVYTRQIEYLKGKGFAVTAFEYPGGHTLTGLLMGRMWKWLKGETL